MSPERSGPIPEASDPKLDVFTDDVIDDDERDEAERAADEAEVCAGLEKMIEGMGSSVPKIVDLYDDAIRFIDDNIQPQLLPGPILEVEDDSQWPNQLLNKLANKVTSTASDFTPNEFESFPESTRDAIVFSERYSVMMHLLRGSGGYSNRLNGNLTEDIKSAAVEDLRAALVATYPDLQDLPFVQTVSSPDDYSFKLREYLDETYDQKGASAWRAQHPLYRIVRPYLEKYADKLKRHQASEPIEV